MKNVRKTIEDEVERRLLLNRAEQARTEESKAFEVRVAQTSTTAEENLELARKIFKTYQDYKTEAEK